jgi:hypothetical protein
MAASAGSWSAPSLLYWEKPDGSIAAVDLNGAPLRSPPDLKVVSAESLGYDPSVGQLVIDQWGRVIVPYHPPGGYGLAADGSDADEELNPTDTAWPPTNWPPGATGLPSSCPAITNYDYDPDDYSYWIDPSTGKPVLVLGDGGRATTPPGLQWIAGKPLEGPPSVQDLDGKVIDQWGNEIKPLWSEPTLKIGPDGAPVPPSMPAGSATPATQSWSFSTKTYWKDPSTGDLVVLGPGGTPHNCPPTLVEVGGKVYDPWGNEVKSYWPDGNVSLDEKGMPLPENPPDNFTPPDMRYWTDPSTGDLVVVNPDGTPMQSPPALVEMDGKVADPWGNEVKSYWPAPNPTTTEDGTPLPTPDVRYTVPGGMKYWTDPVTGDLVAVMPTGEPILSPPALTDIGGKVLDQWGNEVKSYWPEANLGLDEQGKPLPGHTMPDGFTPPTMRYWQDPSTGQLVAVDPDGNLLHTPPQLTEVTGQLREALGFPPGQYQAVVDQWGNPIMPLHPPGNYGVDETGNPTEDAGSVPDWPPDEWPPGSGTDEVDVLDDEGSMIPPEDLEPVEGLDTAVEPDPTATPPDDVEATQPGSVTAEGLDDVAEPEATATPPDDVQATAPEMEQTSAPLGDTFDPGDRYSGVAMAEGEVALDDDFNQPGTVDDLVTAGLDEPITAESRVAEEALEEAADDTITPAEVSEIEGLVTAGLEPEFKVEEAEFKVEEPVFDDAVPELKWGDESIEEASSLPLPLPSPTIAPEVGEGRGEPIEMTDVRRAEPIEEAVIEPIEILVEPIDTAAIREVSPIGEADESDRLASLDDEDEEEEQAQP